MIGTAKEIVLRLMNVDSDKKWILEEYKEKRSRNQNSYYWQLVGQIARKSGVTSERIHNINLRHLGLVFRVSGEVVVVYLPDTEEAEETALNDATVHLKPTSQIKVGKEQTFRAYLMLRGSSDFNVSEMSSLVDLAIQDAKALGIETMPPDELLKMRLYEQQNEAHEHSN